MINRVILVGRLTKDPTLKYTPNGVPTCSFTLAVNRPFSNQQGERESDFINVVVWRRQAENAANYLKKGSLAGIDGRIQTRHYNGQDDKRIYVTEVIADSVQFLDNKGGQGQGNTNASSNNSSSNTGNYTKIEDDPFSNNGKTIDISDDDLPF